MAPAAYPQAARARKTQLSAGAGRRWSRVTMGATIRWYLRAMMMRGSHQPPLRRGLSTLRWRARRGWAVWRPRLRLVRAGAAEASGAAGSAESGWPPARRPLSRRLSTRPVMRLAPASSMSWGSSSMMVGRGRTPSNWLTMKAAAAPSRWYLPESESNSIGWLSIPTMRLTPRRRRGIGLVGRPPGIVGVVLAVLITVLIVGSWLPQVGSRGSGLPPVAGRGPESPTRHPGVVSRTSSTRWRRRPGTRPRPRWPGTRPRRRWPDRTRWRC